MTRLPTVRRPAQGGALPGQHRPGPGVGAHKDSGVLTLLLVEPDSEGLQVETLDGTWVDVPPKPGAFIVNIGELLEVATGGYLRATRHRVRAPRPGTDRISIPFFLNPALDATIPIIELPPELAALSRGVEADPDNPIFSTYGENAWKSRVRAHRMWRNDIMGSLLSARHPPTDQSGLISPVAQAIPAGTSRAEPAPCGSAPASGSSGPGR